MYQECYCLGPVFTNSSPYTLFKLQENPSCLMYRCIQAASQDAE